MSWINIAATRYDLMEKAESGMAFLEKEVIRARSGFYTPVLFLMADRKDLFERAITIYLEAMKPLETAEDDQIDYLLPQVISMACMLQMAGYDQVAMFSRIAEMKLWERAVTDTQKEHKALHQLICRLVMDSVGESKKAKIKPGHVNTARGWYQRIETMPALQLFDLAVCPDHAFWDSKLRWFVLPLALLAVKEHPNLDVFELLRLGAYPERHQEVLYERIGEKPKWGVKPDPTDPSTWEGFDAIEVRDGELLIYHYLGFHYQAPLCFEGENLNAFDFLEQLDLSWRIVQNTLTAEKWEYLSKLRQTMPCIHVVVHDKSVSRYLPDPMREAEKYYGVTLRAADFMEV